MMDDFISRESAKRLLVSDYAYAAADLLDEVPAADVVERPQWIGVKDRLPENCDPVLVRCTNTTIAGGYITHIGSCDHGERWSLRTQPGLASFPVLEWQVTHWMPLPPPPKESDDY